MVQRPVIFHHRVFVRPEACQMMLDEIFKLRQCTRAGGCPGGASGVDEFGGYGKVELVAGMF